MAGKLSAADQSSCTGNRVLDSEQALKTRPTSKVKSVSGVAMTLYGHHPRLRRDDEPVELVVWHWFICNGPHGERFEWQRGDIDLLRRFMDEKCEADPEFVEKARLIALEALENSDPLIVIKGIHVLTIVGTNEDLDRVVDLTTHSDERVVKNARAALFERGHRKRKS